MVAVVVVVVVGEAFRSGRQYVENENLELAWVHNRKPKDIKLGAVHYFHAGTDWSSWSPFQSFDNKNTRARLQLWRREVRDWSVLIVKFDCCTI